MIPTFTAGKLLFRAHSRKVGIRLALAARNLPDGQLPRGTRLLLAKAAARKGGRGWYRLEPTKVYPREARWEASCRKTNKHSSMQQKQQHGELARQMQRAHLTHTLGPMLQGNPQADAVHMQQGMLALCSWTGQRKGACTSSSHCTALPT